MINKTIKIISVSLFSISIFGCSVSPNIQQAMEADYGYDLTGEECNIVFELFMEERLKDPDSVRYMHSEKSCEKGYFPSVPILGLDIAYGWFMEGKINAKNGYGGYGGYKKYQALIKNGDVIRYCIADSKGACYQKGLR